VAQTSLIPSAAERIVIPLHPVPVRLPDATLDSISGQYREPNGHSSITIYHEGDALYEKDQYGGVIPLAAESPTALFYPNGSSITRLLIERDPHGRVTAIVFHDDRHEERWERINTNTKARASLDLPWPVL
jgi:hypothetical protein